MKREILISSLALSLFSGALRAQSDSLRVQELEEVSITAVRAAAKAPVTQITVTKKEIEAVYQGQDGAFLLEQVSPAIVSTSESGTSFGNYGSFRLRGIDQSRVNITLNGVPLNDMLDQGVFFSNFIDFGNSIESLQVQRGVGTSSLGLASYAGSINFESVSLAHQKAYSEVQLSGGSFNSLRSSAEVATGLLENKTAFYLRTTHLQSDGYRRHSGTNSQSLFFSGGYFGEKHSLKFTSFAGKSRNELAYFAVPEVLIEQDPRTNLNSPNDHDLFSQWMTQLQHGYRLAPRTQVLSTLYYSGAGGDFFDSFFDTSGFVGQFNYPLYNDHLGLMSFVDHRSASGRWKLNGGLHANRFWRNNREYQVPFRTDPYYDDETRKDEISAFAKAEYQWGQWRFYGDLQWRQVQIAFSPDTDFIGVAAEVPTRNYQFLNPRAGLSFDWAQHWQSYVSFGRSGREPTRIDIINGFSLGADQLALAQNTNLAQAEFVNDLELGLRYQSEKLSAAFNFFYMAFENEIAPIGEPLPFGQFVRINQKSSYRRGLEWQAHWQFLPRFSLRTQGAYMQAAISSYSPATEAREYLNVRPILSPEWNLRGELAYALLADLELRVSARYLSSAYLDLTNNPDWQVPQSLVFNAALDWRFWREHQFLLQVNNLSNERYYTAGQVLEGVPGFFVQPPLHFFATLRMRF